MRLYLARHAQCEKNLIGIPGGSGSALTQTGKDEANLLARRVAALGHLDRIVACPTVQTTETAQIIADSLHTPMEVRTELRSIHLGVLTGVPTSQARNLYPASSSSMDKWRSGAIELCDVHIEGMEDPVAFYRRGIQYLLNYIDKKEVELIVATTSILILLQNANEMKGAARGQGYRARSYENAQLIELEFSPTKIDWLRAQAMKHGIA